MAAALPNVRVGVGVFLVRHSDRKIVVGVRKGSHGSGTIALPGGHLEHGESFDECAKREVGEETGLQVSMSADSFVTATNDVMVAEGKHYVTVFVKVNIVDDARPEVLEPEKCERWVWWSRQDLEDAAKASASRHDPLR